MIKEGKDGPSRVTQCLQHAWPSAVCSNIFMAHVNGRYTPMGMGKIHLEQDVSFGT